MPVSPLSFSAQAKTLDDVIPQIDQCAQNINTKVFSRPSEAGKAAALSESEASATRNPELLIPDNMIQSEKMSYLNPNFVELTPEGSLRQPGIWKSQTIVGAILSMDVGDVDGDGRPEVVVMTKDKVTVYRKEGQGLKTLATYAGTKVDNFISLSVLDVNHDGTAKIFVNNLRKQNAARGAATDTMYGEPWVYGRPHFYRSGPFEWKTAGSCESRQLLPERRRISYQGKNSARTDERRGDRGRFRRGRL